LCVEQFKEFLGTYNKLTENCFMDCVKDFTSREVKPEEVTMTHTDTHTHTHTHTFISSGKHHPPLLLLLLLRPAALRVVSRSI